MLFVAWSSAGGYHRRPAATPPSAAPEQIMNESEFNQAADTTLLAIEEAVEAAMDTMDGDVDFETSAGILTLTFDNGSKVIINRQVATREIWVAARSGGFHCGQKNDGWFCNTTGETLSALVSRVCSEQSGETMVLAF
jgi:CyaY protein